MVGNFIMVLGESFGFMASTVDGAFISIRIVFLGLSMMIPTFFAFIQHYCEQPLPKAVNYVSVIGAFTLTLLSWTSERHNLFFESIHLLCPETHGIYCWEITRGVLYPASVFYPILIMIFAIILLIKRVRRTSGAMKKKQLIFICFIAVYAIPYVIYALRPGIIVGQLGVLYGVMSSVLLYLGIFRYDLLENEEAARLQKTINDMIANISHDLKTPLTVLNISLKKLLNVSPGDPSYSREIQVAYNKNLDLQRLIQNLIEVSRIESVPNLCNPEWVSLNDLLSDIQEKYADHLENAGLSFDVLGDSGDVLILCDPAKIWSVFDNLIYNAARHTHAGGITVAAATKNNSGSNGNKTSGASADGIATITITDTGCGIAEAHLHHIFERFYKIDTGRGASSGDSGLGLYIVKSIMDSTQGKVRIESEVGVGTSVILTFIVKGTCI